MSLQDRWNKIHTEFIKECETIEKEGAQISGLSRARLMVITETAKASAASVTAESKAADKGGKSFLKG